MAKYSGLINSLGNFTTINTEIVREDETGRKTVGNFDRQVERYIDGIQIGNRTLGKTSCSSMLYPYLEVGKSAHLYTWMHPFIGWKPMRNGIIGISYPADQKGYVMSRGQLMHALAMLALMPLLWLIPGIIIGAIIGGLLGGSEYVSGGIAVLIMLSPWFAGGYLLWNHRRMKAEMRAFGYTIIDAK